MLMQLKWWFCCALLSKFILLKCDMSRKPEKFHAYSLCGIEQYKPHRDYSQYPNFYLFSITPQSLIWLQKTPKYWYFFYFRKYFVILSRMIFVGTLPIYVIFLDMLHCLAKKICLYPKHFSLVIQTLPLISDSFSDQNTNDQIIIYYISLSISILLMIYL